MTVNLYADGALVDSAIITEAGGWAATFADKPARYEDGTEIKYTVNEEPVDWYTAVVNGYNITNNYQPVTTSATVTKVWDDGDNYQRIRPKSIAVILQPVGTVYVLSADNGWTVTADKLPIRINGEVVQYSWKEQESVGYILGDTLTSGNNTIFTNRVTRVPNTTGDQKKPKTPGVNRQQRRADEKNPHQRKDRPKVLRILALVLFAFIAIGMVLVPLFASR